MKNFLRNWKTTIGGALMAAGQIAPVGSKAQIILTGIGGLLLGIAAKDGDVTGVAAEPEKKK